ncbi:MAG: bifunctional hydroxymethylpyrimidine kinase/phosphomethylpyrimidine kinase [Hyphomonadaceae bacterium]|jgi:pyridoxine kinase|nr:bifunctional hydroxymethylpyrimidine kinase/phosphomethylpyrimidine kinase [Hyphomonadaceae bacterium]
MSSRALLMREWTAMPLVLVISSFVAASRVGGGIAPYVLGPMKVDHVHVPTCLFGRHPGWGTPGGAPVEAEVMAGMLEGVEANGLFSLVDAVVTGHFSRPEQVKVAVDAIARVRSAPRRKAHASAPERPIVIVDPVMGDVAPGLYIKPETEAALLADLVPLADVLAPNLWEFARLTGTDIAALRTAEDVARAARSRGGRWLISSVPSPQGIGVLHVDVDAAMLAETAKVAGRIPNGTGDTLTLRFAGGLVSGFGAEAALGDATGATHEVIARTIEWSGTELSLAACSDRLAQRFAAPVRSVA